MTEPTTPTTLPSQPNSDSNRTLMLVLSYLGPLALIPLLMETDDREVQWHAKHGLVFFGAWILLLIAATILGQIPFLGRVIWIVAQLAGLGYLVLVILCIIKATKDERLRIPWLSEFADKWQ